ncbi:MAG: aminotransferase class IV, partial [Pseudomonadota bacterium]|nr:aminotransferase class IV [Pseudomonadota bacterium]
NIFMVMPDRKLHTPPPDCFLNGITRQSVIQLAQERAFQVIERHIEPSEIAEAREIFVTGTAAEVTPVGEIDGLKIPVGEVTQTLMADYDKLVGKKLDTDVSAA